MEVNFTVSTGKGKFAAPPSKSMAHRLLICAALSEGVSEIDNISFSDDIKATAECIKTIGAETEIIGNKIRVTGMAPENFNENQDLFCGESGSTLRFLIPVVLLSDKKFVFTGSDRLFERPLGVYEEIFREQNISFEHGKDCLLIKGVLKNGDYRISGNISSQFISGLLFALPLLEGESRIFIAPPVESRPYIDMTVDALSKFGISVKWENGNTIFIPGNQKYSAAKVSVEGDFSNAAFFGALNCLGSEIDICGTDSSSKQGDRIFPELFKAVENGESDIDISNCPDLGPILFAVAAAKNGGSFIGAKRLHLKESDRISSMAEELLKFGSRLIESNGKITVSPITHAPNEILFGHNDHRIVMALSVLLTEYGGSVSGAEAVNKSFPEFFDELCRLGFKFTTKGDI